MCEGGRGYLYFNLCVNKERGGRLGCDASNCDTVRTGVQVCGHKYMKTGSTENGGG